MQYLCIENPGVSPVEGFTIMGVSLTRYSGNDQAIGQFGTGSKHAIALLMRSGTNPIIFCGKTRMDYRSEPLRIEGGGIDHTYSKVFVAFSGDRTGCLDLQRVLECGVHDWKEVSSALREFVSNAIDRCIVENGDYTEVKISISDKPRASRGYTRVYVPLTPDVQRFYNELSRRHLHFGETKYLETKVMPKGARNVTEGRKSAVIYKKGVLVREVTDCDNPSFYDYNLGDELSLDESRHCDNSKVKESVSVALADAGPDVLVPLFRAMKDDTTEYWEYGLDSWYLGGQSWTGADKKEARSKNWQAAFAAAYGPNAVACPEIKFILEYVEKKGFEPVVVKHSAWYKAMVSYGIKSDTSILNSMEKKGRVVTDPTAAHIAVVDRVWSLLEKHKLCNGREKPIVKGYQEVMDAGSETQGEYDRLNKIVYLANDLGGKKLFKVACEELVHHTTGAGDLSRDLQDFLFKLVTEIVCEND